MAGTGPQDLHSLALDLLAASVAALDTIPTFASGLGGAPERSFVTAGEPVADCCPQLTVHVAGVVETPGTATAHRRINQVLLVVTLFRCVPTGSQTKTGFIPPSQADMELAAQQINADGWALWNHLFNRRLMGLFLDRCDPVIWEGLRALVPSGGCAGWTLGLRAAYDGYQEVLN